MIIVSPYSLEDHNNLLEFCKTESQDKNPAAENMWHEEWKTMPNTLPYILKYNNRFSKENGEFYILRDNYSIIGCSGIYVSEFSPKVALAGVRTWINRLYRNRQLVKDYLLVSQRKWAIEHGIEVIACSFNKYNKNVRVLFTRGQNIGTRSSDHMFYKNFNMLDYPVIIQHVPQWIIYENLTDFRFDWNSIRSEMDSQQIL